MATSISLDRILRLGIPVNWHEAVAVAQHVAQRAQNSEVASGLDNCLLSTSGLVEVAGPSRAPFVGDPAAATLTALLDQAQAPRELVALVQKFAGAGIAPGDISADLQFFARPDASAAIGALATRALAAASDAAQQSELERLRAQASVDAPAAPDKGRTSPRFGHRVMAAALVLFAVVGVWTIAATRTSGASSATSVEASQPALEHSPVQQITERLGALVDKGLATIGFAPVDPSGAANAPTVSPAPERPPRRPASPTARVAVPTTPLFVVMMPAAIEPSTHVQDVDDTFESESLTSDAEGDQLSSQPPVLRWPQLPTDPGSAPVDTSAPYLELLVNEAGTVDKVRLRSRDSSFHERMLVSAAKAWVFHPAQQHGQPVKYLLKVPIVSQ